MTAKEMVNAVKAHINAAGYLCVDGLVENFYLGLKGKGFVMLAGDSRMDKGVFAKLFAQALDATAENGRFLSLAVEPDWLAASDLLGRVNLEGKFLPGVIIDIVKRAQDNSAFPYFLCFEGINLSSVEYYLGAVVNGLEARTQSDKKPVITEKYYGSDTAAAKKYGQICIPDNLYVIGTVNMDEASYPLNQQFLDRVHTMELTGDMLVKTENVGQAKPIAATNELFLPRYTQIVREGENWDFVLKYFAQFQNINTILTKARAYVEYTLRDDVILYLMHNLHDELMQEDDAMDLAIIQKVLPRVQGSGKTVGAALNLLLEYCQDRYPKTAQKLRLMLKQLETDDFAALWV